MSISESTPISDNTVVLILPDKPEYVSLARMSAAALANQAGLDINEVEEIKVALSEACTNALRYGCTNDSHYEVRLTVAPKDLIIVVSDSGDGYDFDSVKEPEIGGDQIGGFGLYIIRSLMDSTEIVSERGRGTTITLHKNLRS